MIKALFGELRDGRIGRLRFLGDMLLVMAMLMILVILAGIAVVVVGEAFRSFAQQPQMPTIGKINVVALVVAIVFGVPITFVIANLKAKRWRVSACPAGQPLPSSC